MLKSKTKKRLRLESLEDRQMMAGDVSAYVAGKTLFINGDSAGNGVAIYSGHAGEIEVVGVDQDGSATTINGDSFQSFGKVTNIVVNLKGGDDAVAITDLAIKGFLTIDTGSGDDVVALGVFDCERLDDHDLEHRMNHVNVKKAINITTGAGDDLVLGSNVTTKASLFANTGSGDDEIFFGDMLLQGHQHSFGVVANKGITILTGSGGDTVVLEDSNTSKTISIVTETGDDRVELDNVKAKTLSAVMLPGDDVLLARNVQTKLTTIVGMPGDSTFLDFGNNKFGKLVRVGFDKAPH